LAAVVGPQFLISDEGLMRILRSVGLTAVGLALVAGAAQAQQRVNFDNLTSGPFAWLPDGYDGFKWSNGFVIDPNAWFGGMGAAGGFGQGLDSPRMLMSNGGGNMLVLTKMNGGLFNLADGKFGSAWREGTTLSIRGFTGGNQTFFRTVLLNWDNPQFLKLGIRGVDRIEFESSGGTVGAGFDANSNTSFTADNLGLDSTVTPEPSTWVLMITGLAGLGIVAFTRRRQSQKLTA